MNDDIVEEICTQTNDPKSAYECYYKFVRMFGINILGVSSETLDTIYMNVISKGKKAEGSINIAETIHIECSKADLIRLIKESKAAISNFPDDPWVQLLMCIEAGCRSFNHPWAKQYRSIHNLPNESIAIIVQSMNYGNMNLRSGSGTMLTRDCFTGENKMNGEFKLLSEGDEYLGTIDSSILNAKFELLSQEFPACYEKLLEIKRILEFEFKALQKVDFTIENGCVSILNSHNAKCSPVASVRVAFEMVESEIINERQGIISLNLKELKFFNQSMLSPSIDLSELNRRKIGKGATVSKGCVVGRVALTLADILEFKSNCERAIYVMTDVTTDDATIFSLSDGIISLVKAKDYLFSFYAPSLPPAIDNFNNFVKDDLAGGESKQICNSRQTIQRGQILTLDATNGRVFNGKLELVNLFDNNNFQTVLDWSRKYKALKLYCDVGNPCNTNIDRDGDFEGFACSIEMQENQLYLGVNLENDKRKDELLIKFQESIIADCSIMIKRANGLLVSFRLNRTTNSNPHELKCCPLILYPDLIRLQVESIITAAILVSYDNNNLATTKEPNIEFSISSVFSKNEVVYIINIINETARKIIESFDNKIIKYKINLILDSPNALLTVHTFSCLVDSITFNTTKLTELVYGCSKGDLWIQKYIDLHLLPSISPFERIDEKGVGALVHIAIRNAKEHNKKLKFGILSDHHCTDRQSVEYFEKIGINYIYVTNDSSIPMLAAAQGHCSLFEKKLLKRSLL